MKQKIGLPLLGNTFPRLEVVTTQGKKILPDDYQGKWLVLFSHPADFTPVCTTEFVAFANKSGEFEKLGAQLVGLSIDQVFSHIKWLEWIRDNLKVEIPFPVIADDMGKVARKLGMVHPRKGSNTVRAVFIVDPKGILRLVLYYPQEIGRNVEEILRALRALQVSDRERVALPHNWPNNELIGDKAIVPPAADEKTARKRKEEFSCYDWWFCYRPLSSLAGR